MIIGLLHVIIRHPRHPNHLSKDPDSISRTFLEQFALFSGLWWVSFTTLTYCPIKAGKDYFVTLDLLPLYDSNILNNKIHLVKRRAYTGIQNDWSPRALDQGDELVSTGCETIGRLAIRRNREHHPLTIAAAQTKSGNTIPVTQSHHMTSH